MSNLSTTVLKGECGVCNVHSCIADILDSTYNLAYKNANIHNPCMHNKVRVGHCYKQQTDPHSAD